LLAPAAEPVTATATTTITGVSLLTRQRRAEAAVFEIGLSPEGIEIRRPGRPAQHLAWARVSEWEIDEHKGELLLTLRGDGATTRLLVPGWDFDELEALLRELTASDPTHPLVEDDDNDAAVDEEPHPKESTPAEPVPAVAVAPLPEPASAPDEADVDAGTPATRAGRRRAQRRPWWRPVVTMALLALVAAAVALVLLQSAGVISWSFLGPNGSG
jgi:hypothetical protein